MVVLNLANGANHDGMQNYAAFHLDFHCLPKYMNLFNTFVAAKLLKKPIPLCQACFKDS